MSKKNQDKKRDKKNENAFPKPDPETLNTTDPQENMKGPVSSVMQNIKDSSEKNNNETKEEADRKKDQNT